MPLMVSSCSHELSPPSCDGGTSVLIHTGEAMRPTGSVMSHWSALMRSAFVATLPQTRNMPVPLGAAEKSGARLTEPPTSSGSVGLTNLSYQSSHAMRAQVSA